MSILQEKITPLLGKPWKVGAKGPDFFDCWGLLQHVQWELAGRKVLEAVDPPTSTRALAHYIKNHPATSQWHEVSAPVHLGAVLLAHLTYPLHVGTYLDFDGGIVLHCQYSTGVTIDTLLALKHSGWRKFMYYDWTS